MARSRVRRKKDSRHHGMVKHQSKVALVIVDVLNEFDFPEASQLLKSAKPMAKKIAALKLNFQSRNLPVIYANDNFGQWRSDREQVIGRSLHPDNPGKVVSETLIPDEGDYFVLKPKHSAFYSTTLETLLSFLGTETLVLTGIAGNICVLHTALDAHVRGFKLVIPRDCVASNTAMDAKFTQRIFKEVLSADTRPSPEWWRRVGRTIPR